MTPRKIKQKYLLKLYIVGKTTNSEKAVKHLREILDTDFKGVYSLKIIDVVKNPELAEKDKILAVPTLSRILPRPVRSIIGDLSDKEKVLLGLDLV